MVKLTGLCFTFYLLSWGLCSAYISVLTLVCVRQNVAPKFVFWLYNSVHLVFVDIGHGLVIPWRMGIPWRAQQDDKERPKQFYVLKPPELRIGRFDKMATQRPAPTPPPPSLCSSTSCSTSPPSSPSSESPPPFPRINNFFVSHPHCPHSHSPEQDLPLLEINIRKLSLVSSIPSIPSIPSVLQSSQELLSSCSHSPEHPQSQEEANRAIIKVEVHEELSPADSLNLLPLLASPNCWASPPTSSFLPSPPCQTSTKRPGSSTGSRLSLTRRSKPRSKPCSPTPQGPLPLRSSSAPPIISGPSSPASSLRMSEKEDINQHQKRFCYFPTSKNFRSRVEIKMCKKKYYIC